MSPLVVNILCVWGGAVIGFFVAGVLSAGKREDEAESENWDV